MFAKITTNILVGELCINEDKIGVFKIKIETKVENKSTILKRITIGLHRRKLR